MLLQGDSLKTGGGGTGRLIRCEPAEEKGEMFAESRVEMRPDCGVNCFFMRGVPLTLLEERVVTTVGDMRGATVAVGREFKLIDVVTTGEVAFPL